MEGLHTYISYHAFKLIICKKKKKGGGARYMHNTVEYNALA